MHLRYTAWLVLTLLTATLAGCNNFTATNQTIAESDSVAQSGPVVQSGAAQSAPIAQPEPPSPPIAQSGAVMQSRPIIKSEALSAYVEHSMQQCAGSSAVVQSGAIGQSEPPSGPDPSYRDVIAYCFKTTFKNYATYELFEISEPRWVSSIKGWNWLVCVRFVDRGRRRSYALLLNGSTVVDGHYAYQTDNCGSQSYVVFEQMGGIGLMPLH